MLNTLNKKWVTVGAAACCAAIMLTACGGGSEPARQTIEKPGKVITVMEPPAQSITKVAVSQILTLENMRGLNFLYDDQLVVLKPNEDEEQISIEGTEMFPNNLYSYNLDSKASQVLHSEAAHQGGAILSPDHNYLFYKVNVEETAHGYIMNLATKETAQVSDDTISMTSGEWIDATHVMFVTNDGRVVVSDTEGNQTTVVKTDGFIFSAAAGVGGVYYVVDEVLYFQAAGDGEPEKIADHVVWVNPSPEKKQLAIVKHTTETTRTMTITDLKGNDPIELGSATQVFGMSWSPDGTKLAYSLTSENGGASGIFVADSVTGEVTSVKSDVKYVSDQLGWSPSGKKIVASSYDDELRQFNSYVISLK